MLIVISNSGHQSADSGGENETGLVRFTIQGPTLYLFNYLVNFLCCNCCYVTICRIKHMNTFFFIRYEF